MDLQKLENTLDEAQARINAQRFYLNLTLDQETIELLRDLLPSTTGEAGQALNARLEPPKSGVKPTVGRIVHIHYSDTCRPAIVTRVTRWLGEYYYRLDVTEFRPHDLPQLLNAMPPSPMANGWHWPQECPGGR